MTPFNAYIQMLINIVESTLSPPHPDSMNERMRDLHFARRGVTPEEVQYVVEQLQRLKDGA